MLLAGLTACATARVAVGPWQAPLGRQDPLVGRVWDVRAARFVTPDAMVRELSAARFVLLGEKHDNPDHHQIQAVVLRALLATGRRPVVAFEMFTPDDAPAIARYLAAAPRDAAGLGAAVDWKQSGWPDWGLYQPIAQAALDAGVPIVAANLTPATARALARGQRSALPADLAERYALDQPPPTALQAALTTEIREAHCGHFPADRVDGMVLAQRARDSALAESLLAGPDGGVLIAGTGHVRNDRGVPSYLRRQGAGRDDCHARPARGTGRADAAGGLRGGVRRRAAVRLGVVHAPDGRRRSPCPLPPGSPTAARLMPEGQRARSQPRQARKLR